MNNLNLQTNKTMQNEKFETPALIELFGHTRMAGTVKEQTIGGATFVRVDVPETSGQGKFTRFLNPSAIYAINPITEEMMQHLAEDMQVAPISVWDIRKVVENEKKRLREQEADAEEEEEDLPY